MASELEQAVLGVVWLHQPCTAYQVRKIFAQSISSHWSGSAGSIYPLLRRLEDQGVVKSAAREGDSRGTLLYKVTRRGAGKLKAWLKPPLPSAEHLLTMDPLRVRVRFFDAISPKQRMAVVVDARAKLASHLALARELAKAAERQGDTHLHLAHRSGILSIRAQIAWLREVEATVDQ